MDDIKYLHIIWHDVNDGKFVSNLIKMINTEPDFFNKKEHLFITPYERLYKYINDNNNVVLVNQNDMLNVYGRKADWIFVHAMNYRFYKIAFMDNAIAKKIIWRTWGHDVFELSRLKPIYKYNPVIIAVYILYIKKVNKFKAIGIANEVDKVNIQSVYGNNIITYELNYSYDDNNRIEILRNVMNLNSEKREYCRIMVGHSGYKPDNHIEVLRLLSKYRNENIKISLVLSYGEKEYMDRVIDEAVNIFGDKVEIINKYMTFEEYALYLNNVDVAILDFVNSNALGNLSILIYLKKKIFINKKGIVAKCLRVHSAKANYSDNIPNLTFEEFKSSDSIGDMSFLCFEKDKKEICQVWKDIFNSLERKV